MRRLSLICILLMFTLVLLITPARAAEWTVEATPLDLVAGPMGTAALLAPDGSGFAYFRNHELCLYTLSGEKGNCITFNKDVHIDVETLQWSPDSKKIAFSEDFLITFRDSDIWLYDTETNTVKDLTPNANREKKLISNSDPKVIFTVDLIPQWSSDSLSIYFIRYAFSTTKEARPHFTKINITDGTIEEAGVVESSVAFSSYSFELSPNNSQVAYNTDTRGRGKDGTWFLDLATQETQFAAAPVQGTSPWSYQFSSDGNLLLSIGANLKFTGSGVVKPEESPIYTVPVAGGRQQSLNADTYVYAAGWGPEGTELAYTTFDKKNPDKEGLYITSAPGQVGELVLPGRFIAPSPRGLTPILWAANNTLLLSQAPKYKLMVVQLKLD